ncbi:MAG: biotin/lipoyl-binding protein [Chloroflexi bacterium]|nr:biotin/lipoyl-binding protein [Chloroflexota bacterium]
MAKFKLAIPGEQREFEATRQGNEIWVTMGETTAVFHLLYHDAHTILLEQTQPDGSRKRIRLAGTKDGDRRQLWVNGRTFIVERVRERGRSSQNDTSLSASIPAVVTEILVAIGDDVVEGDKLILLESMKMVIPIQAPYAGRITAVHCTQGKSVQAGNQLIELEEIRD